MFSLIVSYKIVELSAPVKLIEPTTLFISGNQIYENSISFLFDSQDDPEEGAF
ncbi:hypothetical protein CLU96_0324 [Chryseobacterium sp. 52]|nr:hypothetical protein CLU96_0324 [Chryseobacterium sp. 52]